MMVQVSIPYPTSANRLWRSNAKSKTPYLNPDYLAWKEAARRAIPMSAIGKITGKHSIEIVADRPDRRRRDVDNLLKATLDALKGNKFMKGVIEDDSDTEALSIRWAGDEPVKPAMLHIVVSARAPE